MNTRFTSTLLVVGLSIGSFCALQAFASEVQIADGDTEALLLEIASARTSGVPTDIVLARNGTYTLPAEEIHFGGSTTLRANGATLESVYPPPDDPDGRGTQFVVDAGSVVTIVGADFSGDFHGWPWLRNTGQLTLEKVTIHGDLGLGFITLLIEQWWGTGYLIMGAGAESNLELRNVTIDIGVSEPFQPKYGNISYLYSLVNVRNGGSADMQHVTLRAQHSFDGRGNIGVIGFSTGNVDTRREPLVQAKISNSVIFIDATSADDAEANVSGVSCANYDESTIMPNGGIIVSEPGCGFGRTVTDAGFGTFGDHGGPVPTLSLEGTSPAIGFGVAAYCLPTDARGYARDAACDSGAFEFAAGPGEGVDLGGAAGYWNVPGTHGFLAISFPAPGIPLVVWSTFDEEGNPATIYGVGEYVDGDTILVSAAAVDLPVPGSDAVRIEPVIWGELRFDIASCNRASLVYDADRAGFTDGADALHRLTHFVNVGCTDTGP